MKVDVTAQKLWQRFERMPSGCWQWTGYVTHHGYGQMRIDGRYIAAHRVSYELLVGPISDGLVIDHLCRNTRCVNPAHLEPVTQAVNVARSMNPRAVAHRENRCLRGHPFTPENTKWQQGRRCCRICLMQWRRANEYRTPRRTATK